jgi:hypothetical protein
VIAVLGHGSTQASHAVQSSLMINAIPVSCSLSSSSLFGVRDARGGAYANSLVYDFSAFM